MSIERGLSANTVAAYSRDLDSYVSWLTSEGIEEFDSITLPVITDYLQQRANSSGSRLSASSQSRLLSSIKSFHSFAADEGYVLSDVSKDIKPPKIAQRLPKAISIEQMTAILEAASSDEPIAIRNLALLELLYATGARISEAVGLNVDDFTQEEGMIRLRGKGGKQRIVPVGSMANKAIHHYLVRVRPLFSARGKSTPALFLGPRGSRLSRQMAWLIIREAADKAQLGIEISPHTFRHSFATHMLAGGADVRVVQELLGHSSVATTQIYTLVTADTLRETYLTAHPRAQK